AGMHFFNPAPVMPLVEIVRGALTSQETMDALIQLGKKLGKQTVLVKDTPGFIVNRIARPFYGEALRIMGEGAASHEQIDRIVRMGAGFRMGPFELMDLIGIDINFAATKSIYEQTFQEPRYRPSHIQAQMVHQMAFGRKSGRGFYRYDRDSEIGRRAKDVSQLPNRNQPEGEAARVIVCQGTWAPELMNLLVNSRYQAAAVENGIHQAPVGIVTASKSEGMKELIAELDLVLPTKSVLLAQCGDTTLSEIAGWIDHPERLVGFDGLFLENSQIVTLTTLDVTSEEAQHEADSFFNNLGLETAWINDIPGLVLPRITCCLVNEGAFAAGEGTAPPETIDLAMRLGANYPQGPLEWGRKIGSQRVAAVLDHLFEEYREERYRTAPLLRKWARLEMIKKKSE
ncbi:MAG: 3-hydroxybutyryl-CoA dehydrogenase, partial [Chloroflexi bacterium]